ncbi:MAG TPA: P-loop NTPase [Microbacterium sp.]|uniref:AAA family ATPase n=1 Tax=Microbacterium sp. TaxID=51671 RepID=UPI002B4A1707|nr:P-loop NTPase [Microbacterium sp.]HKT57574.1 P-loop NTPase [Microbacterium sp.]
MTAVVVAVDGERGALIADRLARVGHEVRARIPARDLAVASTPGLDDVLRSCEVIVLQADRHSLTAAAVARCDRAATRILPLCATPADERRAAGFGTAAPLPLDADAWTIGDALTRAPSAPPASEPRAGRVITVWGAAGSPGRTTIAAELAVELSRGDRDVALVDADTHAPSLALLLGIAEEGPGFAAACRQAERGLLDARELDRISIRVAAGAGQLSVLPGINRASRWPELSELRVSAALEACRTWADDTVVDVSSSLERDEEIVSDVSGGPRRNAATLAALAAADLVVAVVAADPLGVARFLRVAAEMRGIAGQTPVAVIANRLRGGALGPDARGQIRRTLERFAGTTEVWFVPHDARAVDAAVLTARPVADAAPRSGLVAGIRRFVGDALPAHAESSAGAFTPRHARAGRAGARPVG